MKHIVVCGHSHCGAVSAALAPESLGDLPYVAAWLDESGPSLPDDLPEGDGKLNAAVEANVRAQIDNLKSLQFVADAVAAGDLELHGWVYEFETGEIREYDQQTGQFEALTTVS